MRFGIDIDGVMFKRDEYPKLGEPNWEMVYTCAMLQNKGHKVHMFTSREGEALEYVYTRLNEIGFTFDPYDMPCNGKIRCDFYVDDRFISPTAFPRVIDSFVMGESVEDRWDKEQ